MPSSHRHSVASEALRCEIHDLRRSAGQMRPWCDEVPAPADLGVEMIGVPEGAPVGLDLRLESVVEGVLVTGTARAHLEGECSRCLTGIEEDATFPIQELYFYPDRPADEDSHRISEEDVLDLEPALRDAVVLNLPFIPLCRPDCEGLCPECGTNLNEDPDHDHPDAVDPRWAGLSQLRTAGDEQVDTAP